MKITLSAALLLLLASCAQPSGEGKFSGALLWKVSGNGLESPSYILGTHHLASADFVEQIAGFRQAMDETMQVYGELKMDSASMGDMQMRLMSEAMMPDSVAYEELLSEDDYRRLDEGLLNTLGMGLQALGKFKPGMLSSMHTMALYAKIVPGFNSFTHQPIDSYVQNLAAEQGKECFGIETVDDQIAALFNAEPLKKQAEQLACSVRHTPETIDALKKLNEYYAAGDLDNMYDLAMNNPDDPCPSSEEFSYKLNKERNDKWLAILPGIMAEKATFVAVGAMHLAGEDGLLSNLDKMGYTIEAIK